jgi:hypothetical protein
MQIQVALFHFTGSFDRVTSNEFGVRRQAQRDAALDYS